MPAEAALYERTVLLVAAHPDDETIGAGGILPRFRNAFIVHVTDGAPRNMADALRAGFERREEYAEARRMELLAAISLAGIPKERLRAMGWVDQEVWLDMAGLSRRVLGMLEELRPGTVLTHPYEGGHPDHDSTAFAVHAACALSAPPASIFEFASYHAFASHECVLETGRFLSGQDEGQLVALTAGERARKTAMLECFATQRETLRHFSVDEERFRAAPAYDFTAAPHAGKLLYECFPWRVTGVEWRAAAAEAMKTLGLEGIL